MTVILARAHLLLPNCSSLKEKRSRIRPVLEKLRSQGFAASEVGDHDLWGNAEIAWVAIGPAAAAVIPAVQRSRDWLDSLLEIEVQASWTEELLPSG